MIESRALLQAFLIKLPFISVTLSDLPIHQTFSRSITKTKPSSQMKRRHEVFVVGKLQICVHHSLPDRGFIIDRSVTEVARPGPILWSLGDIA